MTFVQFLNKCLGWLVSSIGWLCTVLVAYALFLLITSLFWKNETGKELRRSCLAHVALFGACALLAYILSKCT